MKNFLPDEKVMCHHTGFTRSCKDLVVNCSCPKWVGIHGVHPSTGEKMDCYGCADSLFPTLMVEQSHKMYMMSAAIEDMRNQIVMRMDEQKAIHFEDKREQEERRLAKFGPVVQPSLLGKD